MPDIDILTLMSGPLTIGGQEYLVAWNSERNLATILVLDDNELKDLTTDEGEEITFPRELDAHRYLIGLKVQTDGDIDKSWRDL